MISVIFALAIAQLFAGVADLILTRARVRFYLPHAIWVVTLFLLTFLHWWSLWTFRELTWNFAMFFYSLLGPSLMFFATTIINPRYRAQTTIDLEAHFLGIRKPFLVVFLLMLVFFSLDGPLFGTEPLFNQLRAAQFAVFVPTAAGLFWENRHVQAAISLISLASLSIAVVLRFLPGQG
jgi:hypothetical protein